MQAIDLKGSRLSIQQNRLWSLQKNSLAYQTQCAIMLDGNLHIEMFVKALQGVVERHEILRTTFHLLPGTDIPIQVINDVQSYSCPVVDIESLNISYQRAQIGELTTLLQQVEAFHLGQSSPLATWLLRLSSNSHLLCIRLPALCADTSALKLFIEDLLCEYASYYGGEGHSEEQPLQYADVAAWQDELLLDADAAPQREYWREIDLHQLGAMPWPFKPVYGQESLLTGAEVTNAFAPDMHEFSVEKALSMQISNLAQRYGVSVSACFLACWQIMLQRLSDTTDFLVGTACDGRIYEDLLTSMGLYTRFVPIHAHFEKDLPFEQVLTSVDRSLREAAKRQAYFTWEDIGGKADGDAVPSFFPLSFEYDSWPAAFHTGPLVASLYRYANCIEPFMLKLRVVQIEERLTIQLHYDPRFFAAEQIDRLASLLHTLLDSAMTQPQSSINTLSLLTPIEQENLLATFRAPVVHLPNRTLHQLFEEQAAREPALTAVVDGNEQLTYRELNARANQLARVLQRRGVGPNTLVGLCMERSVQMIVGLLAILKAGGAYVPLDSQSPPARLALQLRDCEASWLLTQRNLLANLPDWEGSLLYLQDLETDLKQEAEYDLPATNTLQDLAYVIYTSGSTGVPKGVMISQHSVVNYTQALCHTLAAEAGWQYATVSTLAADLGNTAIFCALVTGGCLQVLDYATITSTQAFVQWVESHPVDVLKIVPSHLSALLSGQEAKKVLPRRALLLGGEVFSVGLLQRLSALEGNCRVFNHYGPTEATIGVLVNDLGIPRQKEVASWLSVPLGKPISNCEVYVLDRRQQIVPVGVVGELYLGGMCLAMGYWQQPEQTAERFVPHPFSEEEGARLYRTGDLAYYNAQGQIEFVGRADDQVKLRGYRIELGEIETALRRHEQVWDCTVQMIEDVTGEMRLVGYIVGQSSSQDLRKFLQVQASLPDYMIPSAWVWLERLPLTANGKLDRRRLPQPEEEDHKQVSERVGPRSPLEEVLLEIWQELLTVPIASIHDNFFHLGGHSLLVTQVLARIRTVLEVDLTIGHFFEAPTIAQLAQRIEQALHKKQGIEEESPPLVPVSREQPLPLSFAQQRLWFLHQLTPENPFYTVPMALRLTGNLKEAALQRSLREIVHRHESLRTVFQVSASHGEASQVLLPEEALLTVFLPVVDLSAFSLEQQIQVSQQLAVEEARQPFDLTKDVSLRARLLRHSAEEHVLLLTLHHISSDGWSIGVLFHELGQLYNTFARDLHATSPLPPLSIQYADFALWQHQRLQGEVMERHLAYWRQQLADLPVLELPKDYSRPQVETFQGARYTHCLPPALLKQLHSLSQQEGVTLFMTLLSAFQILLMRYSGQEDIVVGAPIANRTQPELESLIGFFVNTLVFRTDLSGDPTFVQVLERVRAVALKAYEYQELPFERLVEELQPERSLAYNPLCQVIFQLRNIPQQPLLLQEVVSQFLSTENATAKFDLNFSCTEQPEGLLCFWEYNTDLFAVETIQRLAHHFQSLLESILSDPQQPIHALSLLKPDERRQLLIDWTQTRTAYPHQQSIHQLFEAQVRQRPDAIALQFEEQQYSYRIVDELANQLARQLVAQGVGREQPVGLYMERCPQVFIAILAILKAGGIYVPLELATPPERLMLLMRATRLTLLLAHRQTQAQLPADLPQPVLLWEEIAPSLVNASTEPLNTTVDPENLAYVMYTSGSTGQPKGVAVTHRNVVRLVQATGYVHFGPQEVGLQLAPLGFDASTFEIWGPWLNGGRLIVYPERLPDLQDLAELLLEQHVTLLWLTAGLFHQMVSDALPALCSVQQIVAGGEALSLSHVKQVLAHLPQGGRLVNGYGPTENTTFTCCYSLWHPEQLGASVPIGYPIANTYVYVLDQRLEPVPIGVPGELYIGGAGLARGYLHQPALTAERFIPDPWTQEPGARLYQTGDRVRWRSDGSLEFLGRLDQQVKLRGYRIEPGEIEVVLEQHPAVQQCVVQFDHSQQTPHLSSLVAYVVADELALSNQLSEGSLQQEHVDHWLQLYEETYQKQRMLDDANLDLVGWNSSYTREPIPPEQMLEQIEQTCQRIQALSPRRIVEIGCGTGLLLLRLAGDCEHYVGTDFSPTVLQQVQLQVQAQGWQHVELLQQTADVSDGIAPGAADVVILNSTVQYFPDEQYLRKVLDVARSLLREGGVLFIGDVRHLGLQRAYAASVESALAGAQRSRDEIRERVLQRVQREEELLLAPEFFVDWAVQQGASGLQIQLKRGNWHNELTRFRYDVWLRWGEDHSAARETLDWPREEGSLQELEQWLEKCSTHWLEVRGVPNKRLVHEMACLQWLDEESGPQTMGEWRVWWREQGAQQAGWQEPEEWWQWARRKGYQMVLHWSEQGEGYFDALLSRQQGVDGEHGWWQNPREWQKQQEYISRSLKKKKGNQPLEKKRQQVLIDQLRHYAAQWLPDYMVPNTWMVLHELPLTPNGKIDRRALPKANENDTDQQKRYVRPRDLLEAQLFAIWQEVLGVEQLSILDNFFDLGGHSLLAIGLMSRIQAVLGRDLALSVLFQYPTISEMAAFLRQEAHEDKGSIVVPIQPLGSKTPFFCMPPLGGTFFRYYSLAQRLGTDRPFYGMRLPDLGTYTSIEDLAACYITAIQAIQPQGPYLLGGWSLGGVIAFEMARQLWKQGQETALLASIDSVLPNFPDTPPREVGELDMSDPALARMMLEHIAAIQTEEALNQYEPEEQFRYVVEKLKEFGLWTPDVGIDQARYIMRTIAMNIHVLQAYIPQTYPGHLTLFRAKEGITEAEPGQGQDAIPRYRTLVRGWETVVTGGIDVHVVSGNHSSMLDEPHVRVLASLLKDCINKACARSV